MGEWWIMYLLLGCGDVGFALAQKLKAAGMATTLVDRDEKKIEHLKKLGFRAYKGDFCKPEALRVAGIQKAEVVLVLTSNYGITKRALGAINQLKLDLGIDPVVVARVGDEVEVPEVKKLGATEAVSSSKILAEFTFEKFHDLEAAVREKRLRAVLSGVRGKVAIILHTNPDPDAIASGLAFKRYIKTLGIDADMIYDGQIRHQQNRALVNLLDIELMEADKVELNRYGAHILIDVATTANCALPEDIVPAVVIDHHPVIAAEVKGEYQDLSTVGATATLVTNYLKYAGIELDKPIATALAFGILTDTLNFTRGAQKLDFDAYEYLLQHADVELLNKLQTPALSPETLSVLARAIRGSKVKGGYLVSNVGEVKDRDAIPQAADYLLRREGVMAALVYGICGNVVQVSGRTSDIRLHMGKVLHDAFGKMGSAGGHASIGGATIPLRVFGKAKDKRVLKAAIDRAIGRKFWIALGALRPRRR
jgi:nanoRNase/pAp phosphatase (c-di-AMP/oligoRNAs hydrolase)